MPEDARAGKDKIVGQFGEEILEAGFCSVPNLLLAYQDLLRLSPAELNAVVQIWMEWWSGAEWPRVETIARRMGMSRRGLQKVLQSLRERDLLLRAGDDAPGWAARVSQAVREDVAQYCRRTYGEEAPSPGGYLLVLAGRTSWGQQEENRYDFFPLLVYLRALYREGIREGGRKLHRPANCGSPAQEESVTGPRTAVHPRGEAPFAPMERENDSERGEGRTTGAVVSSPPLPIADSPKSPSEAPEPLDHAARMLIVLDYFVGRVAERWPTAVGRGQPLSRVVAQRYGVARALLAAEVSPAAVSRAPAELVEELLVLSQALRGRGPADLASAIDRALAREDRGPSRRLAYVWPEVPGARDLQRGLRRNLREGSRLPGGGAFREARKLFIVLNRFDVGPPLLEQFLLLCQEVGTGEVQDALGQALRAGRRFVTLAFLREAAARVSRARNKPTGESAVGEDPDRPGPGAGKDGDERDVELAPSPDPNCPTCGGTGKTVLRDTVTGEDMAVLCPRCNSAPGTPDPACPTCQGIGFVMVRDGHEEGAAGIVAPCPRCNSIPGPILSGQGPAPRRASSPTIPWTHRLAEPRLVRYWLEEYGITESALGELAGRVPLSLMRAWMMYLDDQEKLTPEQRRAILVKRLRAGDEPPKRWLRMARALPPLDPVEESMLEEEYSDRGWTGAWSEDVLEIVGKEAAEQWFEVWRARR